MSYDELMEKYKKQLVEIDNLKIENNNLKRIIYGVKREYSPKKEQIESTQQVSLFDDEQNIDAEIKEQIKENVEEVKVYKKKNSKTTKAGIKKSILKN